MQALQGACSVCRSQISDEDAFCQECGTEQKHTPVDEPDIAISTFPASACSFVSLASDLHKPSYKPFIAATVGFCLAVALVISLFYVTEKWAPAHLQADEAKAPGDHHPPQYTLAPPVAKSLPPAEAREEQKPISPPRKLAVLPAVKEEPSPKPTPEQALPPSPSVAQPDSAEPAPESSDKKRSVRPDSSYTGEEMSKYNELLTSYFSRADAGTAGGAKSEPPSFDEWVQQGKPDF